MKKRDREEEIAAAVARGKAEMAKKLQDAEALVAQQKQQQQQQQQHQKEQQKPQSCNSRSCTCCPHNADSGTRPRTRTPPGQDGFVFHLHTHPEGVSSRGNGAGNSRGLEFVDGLAGALYERRRSSVGDAAMGIARGVVDRVRGIEARTAMLEMDMEMGWERERERERDMERERRRYLDRERERERYRYPGGLRGMRYF